jgi:cobalt-zinc-cadmium efflux system protein
MTQLIIHYPFVGGFVHKHSCNDNKNIIAVIFINFFVSGIEILGGYLSGSLLLISDALHNLSDSVSIVISYIAILLVHKKTNQKYTFGYKRAEILAAFVNSGILILITIYISFEAILKLISPNKIMPITMLIFAIISFLGNILSTAILHSQSKHSFNIKSTYLHMLSDSLASFAVIISALLILYFKFYKIDSILTIIVAIYILKEAFQLLIKSTKILMESSPNTLNLDEIKKAIESIDNVKNVHHVHLWSISDNDIFLEIHVELNDMLLSQTEIIKQKINNILKEKKVNHINIQFETNSCLSKSMLCGDKL